MSLTISVASADGGTAVSRLLLAGLAAATVGALSAGPGAPTVAQTQHRALQLVNTSDWSEVLNTAERNLDALQQGFTAHPFAVLTQIGDNLADYARLVAGADGVQIGLHPDGSVKTVTSGLAGIADGWRQTLSTGFDNGTETHPHIPGLLGLPQDVLTHLQGGDSVQAFSDVNTWFLDSVEVMLKPLEPVVTIPERMLENYTGLMAAIAGPTTLWDFGKAVVKEFTEPLIGVEFQFSEILDQLQSAVADGGTQAASATLAGGLAQLVDALLNGYQVPGADEPFIGVLSSGGTLESLLITWPQQIAGALTAGTADLHDLAPAAGLPDLLASF